MAYFWSSDRRTGRNCPLSRQKWPKCLICLSVQKMECMQSASPTNSLVDPVGAINDASINECVLVILVKFKVASVSSQ